MIVTMCYCISYPVPGAPTNLMISGSCDQLIVTWTAPSNTGGLPVKYKVYGNDTFNDTLIYNMHSMRTTTTTTWSGLTANTKYTVRVVAFNNLGDGGNATGTGRTRPEGISYHWLTGTISMCIIHFIIFYNILCQICITLRTRPNVNCEYIGYVSILCLQLYHMLL